MKNFTKLVIVVIALTMTTNASFAQRFGVRAGLNLSNMLMKTDDYTYSDDFSINPGFHIGVTAEFPINDMFSFETGVMLSTKGYKYSEEETYYGIAIKYTEELNLFYLDIPLTGKALFDLGGINVYGLLGPYLGIGLSGKWKEEETWNGETDTWEEDIEWGSDEEKHHLKRLDFGLALGAGVEINSIQIGLSYGLGLANITPIDNDFRISNRVLGISLGYNF